jgi:hypothetical protein
MVMGGMGRGRALAGEYIQVLDRESAKQELVPVLRRRTARGIARASNSRSLARPLSRSRERREKKDRKCPESVLPECCSVPCSSYVVEWGGVSPLLARRFGGLWSYLAFGFRRLDVESSGSPVPTSLARSLAHLTLFDFTIVHYRAGLYGAQGNDK